VERSFFYMWGERGIIGTFFADMHMWASAANWQTFLSSISSRNSRFPRYLDAITIVVEPDFGNKGFGHPDAVLLLKTNNENFVLIVEAKRRPFAQSCGKSRGQQYYNSTLKGQLELNHMLAIALSEYDGARNEPLIEPEWVTATPYMVGRSPGHRATLKNNVVLRSVVQQLSGLPFDNYLHLIVTTDCENPFEDGLNARSFPEVYHAVAPSENAWPTAQLKYGWTNYDGLRAVSEGIDRTGMPNHTPLFDDSYAINLPNMSTNAQAIPGPRTKKSVLVYIPEINRHTMLHCSYQGEKCKLRDYTGSPTTEPIPDERFRRSEILKKASRTIPAQPVSYKDVQFWHDEIRRLNARLFYDSTREDQPRAGLVPRRV